MLRGGIVCLAALALTGCLSVPPSRLGDDAGTGRDGGASDGGSPDAPVVCADAGAANDPSACATTLDLRFDCPADLDLWQRVQNPFVGCDAQVLDGDFVFSRSDFNARCELSRNHFNLAGRAVAFELIDPNGDGDVSVMFIDSSDELYYVERYAGTIYFGLCNNSASCSTIYGTIAGGLEDSIWLRMRHDAAKDELVFERGASAAGPFQAVPGAVTVSGVTSSEVMCAELLIGTYENKDSGTEARIGRLLIQDPG